MPSATHSPLPHPARRSLCLAAASAPWLGACAAHAGPQRGLDAAALARLDSAVADAVAAGRTPGAVLHVEHAGAVHRRAIGHKALVPAVEPTSNDTVYDTASLTKAVVTAPLAMLALEAGALQLDAPVRTVLPAFASGDGITLRHLLTHTSGLPAGLPLQPDWSGTEAAIALACTRTATHAPGTLFRYSDVNYILLGELLQRVAGQPLATLAQQQLLAPLGMRDSGFHPLQRHAAARIAPTEVDAATGQPLRGASQQGTPLRGVVHDPTARRMGGAAGHAGLFSTTADLARYARMLLTGGLHDGTRVLRADSVAAMTRNAAPATVPEQRGLGFDIASAYSRARGSVYPLGSCGHTGFTGCVLWLDAPGQRFHVLLSNRVHPQARESIVALYEQVGTLAAQASQPVLPLPPAR